MRAILVLSVLAVLLPACGGDDDEDGGESEASCAVGATLTGDVNKSFTADDDSAACLVSHSFDSGLFASVAPDFRGLSMSLDIANVTEGQTGAGFPTEIGVIREDERRYATTASGCSATITEHELVDTKMTDLGEERDYRLVGTATCTEPALPEDGGSGLIRIADVAYVFSAVWSD